MRVTKVIKLTDDNLEEVNEFLSGNSRTEYTYLDRTIEANCFTYLVLTQVNYSGDGCTAQVEPQPILTRARG